MLPELKRFNPLWGNYSAKDIIISYCTFKYHGIARMMSSGVRMGIAYVLDGNATEITIVETIQTSSAVSVAQN